MISVKHARHNHTCRGQHLPDTFIIETAADSTIISKQEFHRVTHQISKKNAILDAFLIYAYAR